MVLEVSYLRYKCNAFLKAFGYAFLKAFGYAFLKAFRTVKKLHFFLKSLSNGVSCIGRLPT